MPKGRHKPCTGNIYLNKLLPLSLEYKILQNYCTYCGIRSNLVITFWWLSPSCAHTSVKLPSRTSYLSSRRILLAWISLEPPEREITVIICTMGCKYFTARTNLCMVMMRRASSACHRKLERRNLTKAFENQTVNVQNIPPQTSHCKLLSFETNLNS